jgi:deoxyribodipyrimidine photo-lyase
MTAGKVLFAATRDAALSRIATVEPDDYVRSRNAIEGAVTYLSPYITHGFVNLQEVLAGVCVRHALHVQHKFVFELGWREYFRHVWQHRGSNIFNSLHQGPLPDAAYGVVLPEDIRLACTGVPVVDMAIATLYNTGTLHNHARMWLASYVVHVRKVHWRVGADWLYAHLLDGDLASNHLSWQWVAGTASHKAYLFNADNVARHAPLSWHSPGSVIDKSYEELAHMALQADSAHGSHISVHRTHSLTEPTLYTQPWADLDLTAPDASAVRGRAVWLVHPWSLGLIPIDLPADVLVIGLFTADFHNNWPWNKRRWEFVASRMADMADLIWYGDASQIATALQGASRVRALAEPHLAPWLSEWALCEPVPNLFPDLLQRCDSFSKWWHQVSRDQHALAQRTVN